MSWLIWYYVHRLYGKDNNKTVDMYRNIVMNWVEIFHNSCLFMKALFYLTGQNYYENNFWGLGNLNNIIATISFSIWYFWITLTLLCSLLMIQLSDLLLKNQGIQAITRIFFRRSEYLTFTKMTHLCCLTLWERQLWVVGQWRTFSKETPMVHVNTITLYPIFTQCRFGKFKGTDLKMYIYIISFWTISRDGQR